MNRGAFYSTSGPQYSPMMPGPGLQYGTGRQQFNTAQFTAGPAYTAAPGPVYQGGLGPGPVYQGPPQAPLISTYANGGARQPNFNTEPTGPGSCCMGMCDDDGGPVAEQQWTFVGQGRGSHHCVPQYVFAGEGAGAWAREERYFVDPRAKDRVRCLWTLAGIICCLVSTILSISLAVHLWQHGAPEWLEGFGHHAHHHLSQVGHHIGNAAKVVHGHVVHHGGNAVNAVKHHAPGVWEGVKHHTNRAANAVKEHGPGVWEHVKNASVAVGTAAHGAVKEHGPGVWEHIKNGSKAAVSHAGNAATAVQGAGANAQTTLAPTLAP